MTAHSIVRHLGDGYCLRLWQFYTILESNVCDKKEERRDWNAKELAKAFKIEAHDIKDEPKNILQSINKNLFKNYFFQKLFLWSFLLYLNPLWSLI